MSLGSYKGAPETKHFEAGLAELAKEDEPTLIVLTDAVHLSSTDYYQLCDTALTQCHDLGDRFAILDVLREGKTDGGVQGFRAKVSKYLMYGAAYYPYLQTALSYQYNEQQVSLGDAPAVGTTQTSLTWTQDFGGAKGITVTYTGKSGDRPAVEITGGQGDPGGPPEEPFSISQVLTIDVSKQNTGTGIVKAWEDWLKEPGHDAKDFAISLKDKDDGSGTVSPTPSTPLEGPKLTWQQDFGDNGITVRYEGQGEDIPAVKFTLGNPEDLVTFSFDQAKKELTIANVAKKNGKTIAEEWTDRKPANATGFSISAKGSGAGSVTARTLASIQSTNTALYNQIKAALNQQRVVLPPSAAVAGIYAQVDRERGVWKAPANVSVAAVIGPVKKITHREQEDLNIDPNAGKSINAIREFTGKGTLVWGARTLAGNDNEWRYVSVRRLFNMIEESARKATAFAVFEPNDAATWLKVKAMIESFLYGLWERGALAGSTPKAAYFVNVGLGKTMTPQHILEGLMIVEIGVAAVRPAEFIILRFSHKMQEA